MRKITPLSSYITGDSILSSNSSPRYFSTLRIRSKFRRKVILFSAHRLTFSDRSQGQRNTGYGNSSYNQGGYNSQGAYQHSSYSYNSGYNQQRGGSGYNSGYQQHHHGRYQDNSSKNDEFRGDRPPGPYKDSYVASQANRYSYRR